MSENRGTSYNNGGVAYLLVVAAVTFLVVLHVLDLVLAAICRP